MKEEAVRECTLTDDNIAVRTGPSRCPISSFTDLFTPDKRSFSGEEKKRS